MSNTSIMSIGEMIDTAFGEEETNTVNHKLIQAVLFILARQLRVLDRRVKVELAPYLVRSTSSLSVTEVKIHAMQKKKRKSVKPPDSEREDEGRRKSKRGVSISVAAKGVGAEGSGGAGGKEGKGAGSRRVTQTVAYSFQENSGAFGRGGRGSGAGKGGAGGSDGRKGTEERKGADGRKGTESGRKDEERGKEGPGGKVTAMRMTVERPGGRISVGGKDGGARRGAPGVTSGKFKSDQTAPGKATDKSVIDETGSDKSIRGYKTSGTKLSSHPTTSSEKPKSSSDKAKSLTEKSTSDKHGSSKGGRPEMTILEEFEMKRERQLRVIEKRADSIEVHDKTPTPMASLDSIEATYEKLLVVERIPSNEARKRAAAAAKGRSGTITTARVSIVTQEQFASLVKSVKELKRKFDPIGKADFPENAQLMEELRRGASLTDAMAALQLSARLEATEKIVHRMTNLLTDLASLTPGVHLELLDDDEMEVIYGASDIASQRSKPGQDGPRKSTLKQPPDLKSKMGTASTTPKYSSEESLDVKLTDLQSQSQAPSAGTKTGTQSTAVEDAADKEKSYVTYNELEEALQKLYDELLAALTGVTTQSTVTADEVLKTVTKLEERINASMDFGNRMVDLELVAAQYAEKINVLDTGLSSQMTNYQEELTQMQHDLETGLETMAEVLANTGSDAIAVGELNLHFSSLQGDIDHTMFMQKELKDIQKAFALDLEAMRKQIEILREIKADRDEVADALRDKANLGALNGIVSLETFDAVRGDIEKQIGSAYDKFNNQEAVWQKAIDDLLRELNEKADYVQVMNLQEDINEHLNNLRAKLKFMTDIVGEPKAAVIAKKMFRDAACLSCSTPAQMELEEPARVPALPGLRPPAIGAEAPKHKEEKSYPPCYPGLPILHPIDPRAHVCNRWCGGSHTTKPNAAVNKPSIPLDIEPLPKPTTTLGTDGKIYKTDEPQKPCTACNIPKTTPHEPSKADAIGSHVPNQGGDSDSSFALTPLDFVSQSMPDESASVTPPPQQTSEDL